MSSDQPPPRKARPKSAAGQPGKTPPPAVSSPAGASDPAVAPANSLTPEEQMALFEKELKENDWGHQPC